MKRRTTPARPAAATKTSPTAFVVVHVRHALQHAGAAGA